jgi:hypothetical protein
VTITEIPGSLITSLQAPSFLMPASDFVNTTFGNSGWFWGGTPTGAATSTVGIFSAWVKPTTAASQQIIRLGDQNTPFFEAGWSGTFSRFTFTIWDTVNLHVNGENTSNGSALVDVWHHVLASWGSPTD